MAAAEKRRLEKEKGEEAERIKRQKEAESRAQEQEILRHQKVADIKADQRAEEYARFNDSLRELQRELARVEGSSTPGGAVSPFDILRQKAERLLKDARKRRFKGVAQNITAFREDIDDHERELRHEETRSGLESLEQRFEDVEALIEAWINATVVEWLIQPVSPRLQELGRVRRDAKVLDRTDIASRCAELNSKVVARLWFTRCAALVAGAALVYLIYERHFQT